MNLVLIAGSLTLGLCAAMFLLMEVGRYLGRRAAEKGDVQADQGIGTVDAAVFGLLGLLLGFSFAGASSRFDARRGLIVQEANNIGTAYLRLDLLPTAAQPALRDLFRRYVDARLEVYRQLPDLDAAHQALAQSNALQKSIWEQAIAAGREAPPQTLMVLLPALNQMIDITTTRTMAARTHSPAVVFVLLFGLALASALFVGHAMSPTKPRRWLHLIGYPVIISLAIYVIIDLEFPRFGLVTVHAHDQVLVELRQSME